MGVWSRPCRLSLGICLRLSTTDARKFCEREVGNAPEKAADCERASKICGILDQGSGSSRGYSEGGMRTMNNNIRTSSTCSHTSNNHEQP